MKAQPLAYPGRRVTLAYRVEQMDAGLITAAELKRHAPRGQRIEIRPAVVLLWDFGCRAYVERIRRA